MSAKTKIIVLRKKEVLYAAVLTCAGILLLALFLVLFFPGHDTDHTAENREPTQAQEFSPQVSPTPKAVASNQLEAPRETSVMSSQLETTSRAGILQETAPGVSNAYTPGVYKTELLLGGQSIEIEAVLEKDRISSLRLVDPAESVTTMYPLLQPTMERICNQVYETQSLDNLNLDSYAKYTSLVLLEAIRCCIEKGRQ